MSGRCRECNAIMEGHEMIWYEDRGEHENSCFICRTRALEDALNEELEEIYPIFKRGYDDEGC